MLKAWEAMRLGKDAQITGLLNRCKRHEEDAAEKVGGDKGSQTIWSCVHCLLLVAPAASPCMQKHRLMASVDHPYCLCKLNHARSHLWHSWQVQC